jgi:hypothetical protein
LVQGNERGLEGVFGVGIVQEQPVAHAPNEAAVAVEDRGERGAVPLTNETGEEVRVVLPLSTLFPGKAPGQAVDQLLDFGPHTQSVPAGLRFMHSNRGNSVTLPSAP